MLSGGHDNFIGRSLAFVGAGGTFIEIGKRGIWTKDEMEKARPDVEYRTLAMGHSLRRRSSKVPRADEAAFSKARPLRCRVWGAHAGYIQDISYRHREKAPALPFPKARSKQIESDGDRAGGLPGNLNSPS